MAERRKLPDLSNATPAGLIDMIRKERDKEADAKFYKGVYQNALYGRLNPPLVEGSYSYWDGKEIPGEKFTGTVCLVNQDRFDTDAFKLAHPDLYKEFCRTISFITLTIK